MEREKRVGGSSKLLDLQGGVELTHWFCGGMTSSAPSTPTSNSSGHANNILTDSTRITNTGDATVGGTLVRGRKVLSTRSLGGGGYGRG